MRENGPTANRLTEERNILINASQLTDVLQFLQYNTGAHADKRMNECNSILSASSGDYFKINTPKNTLPSSPISER